MGIKIKQINEREKPEKNEVIKKIRKIGSVIINPNFQCSLYSNLLNKSNDKIKIEGNVNEIINL